MCGQSLEGEVAASLGEMEEKGNTVRATLTNTITYPL